MVTTEWRQNVGFLIHRLGLFSRERTVSHCLGHFATGSPCLYTRVVGRMTRCLGDCSLCTSERTRVGDVNVGMADGFIVCVLVDFLCSTEDQGRELNPQL